MAPLYTLVELNWTNQSLEHGMMSDDGRPTLRPEPGDETTTRCSVVQCPMRKSNICLKNAKPQWKANSPVRRSGDNVEVVVFPSASINHIMSSIAVVFYFTRSTHGVYTLLTTVMGKANTIYHLSGSITKHPLSDVR